MSNPLDVHDCYSGLGAKYRKKLRDYPNMKLLNIALPARFCITGSMGSGKTNTVRNLIQSMDCFDMIYLFAKDLTESLYAELEDMCKKATKKTGVTYFFGSNSLDDLPAVDDFDSEKNNLIIVDDMIGEKAAKLKNVQDLWIRGRRKNCSTIFISQSFYRIPKLIRDNTTYFIFKRISSEKDLKRIFAEFSGTKTAEEIARVYHAITSKNNVDFLMIDVSPPTPQLQYRKNYQAAFQ
jgi:hypothetical protein